MKTILKIFTLTFIFSVAFSANGQIKVDLKKKIQNQTNNRANQKADQAVDKTLDKVEGLFKKKEGSDQENKVEQGDQQEEAGIEAKPSGQGQPGLQSYSKYDFVPGDKVLLYRRLQPGCSGRFPGTLDDQSVGRNQYIKCGPR